MKVALVTNRFPVLSETFVFNHAVGLRDAGIDVVVVTTHASDDKWYGDDADQYAKSGRRFDGEIRNVVVSRGRASTASKTLRRLASMSNRDLQLWNASREVFGFSKRAARAFLFALPLADADIIHFEFSGLAANFLDAIEILKPAKVVVSCRGTAERITPLVDPARARQLREVFARVDRVHCVSADMMRTCLSYGLDESTAFVNHPAAYLGPDAPTRVDAQSSPFRLVSTGRLVWAKGLEFALLAIRDLFDRGYKVRYDILGSGPEEERLRFAIYDLGLADHVNLLGSRSHGEVLMALAEAHVYVVSSVSEGISNAALEAMAIGIPVVSTDAGGMGEAITSDCGIVVPSRGPLEMSRAIGTLLDDEPRRRRMGDAARERAQQHFSVERQIATFVSEYTKLMLPEVQP